MQVLTGTGSDAELQCKQLYSPLCSVDVLLPSAAGVGPRAEEC